MELSLPLAGWGTCVFVWFSGYFAWAAWSGMEIALFAALMFWAFYESIKTGFSWYSTLAACSCLALCRPEGQIIAVCLIAIRLMVQPPTFSDERENIRIVAAFLGFLFAVLGPSLFFRLATGEPASNTLIAKSLLFHPLMTSHEIWQEVTNNLQSIVLFLLGDPSITPNQGEYLLPGMLLFVVLGCLGAGFVEPKGWGYRMYIFAVPLLVVLFAIATLQVWSLHNFRYFAPLYPLLVLLSILGIQTVLLFWRVKDQVYLIAIIVFGLTLTGTYYPVWINRYAENSTTIYEKQIQTAQWVSKNLPSDKPLAINDAGALAYFGEKPILDFVGLASNGFALPYRMGEGALYERMQNIPLTERPQYAALFPTWFEATAKTFDVFWKPLVVFHDPFDREFQKHIYQVNWSYDGMETQPRPATLQRNWSVVDSFDVADVFSEHAHEYTYQFEGKAYPQQAIRLRRNFGYHEEIDSLWPHIEDEQNVLIPRLKQLGLLKYYDILDAGRRVEGEEEFRLDGLNENQDAFLIMRTCDSTGRHDRFHYQMDVFVDKIFVDRWSAEGTTWNWYEPVFRIPAEYINDSSIQVRIVNRGSMLNEYYESYFYWVCQGG